MTSKIYKIPDKNIFRAIFALIALMNLKYLFLLFQIPFTMAFVDFMSKNEFYSEVKAIKNAVKETADFYDEGKVGFVSNVEESNVFDIQDSIKSFYIVQYAIVPSILKNDKDETYVVGKFEKTPQTPSGFEIFKKVTEKIYIYKRKVR